MKQNKLIKNVKRMNLLNRTISGSVLKRYRKTETIRSLSASLTFRVGGVPVGGRGGAHLPGAGESSAVEEDGQVDDVAHVVVSVDVGVSEDAVQVLVDGFDDDVRVTGEDGDERAFGEQNADLRKVKPGALELESVPQGAESIYLLTVSSICRTLSCSQESRPSMTTTSLV